MADKLTLAGGRTSTARFGRPPAGALELVGHSVAITRVQELVRRAAPLDVGVFLTAERGADVDSVARELHGRSRRAGAPYIAVECDGADAPRLIQHLFGTAPPIEPTELESISRNSRIAAARGGTLFLQDVTELPAAVQARFARIARDGEVLVDGQPMATEVRLVASASPAIDAEVHGHRLRSDLFRRLAGVRIDLPPLRDRLEDVPAIAVRVLEEVLADRGLKPRTFTQAALGLVAAVTWPGNLARASGGDRSRGRRARRPRHPGGAPAAGAASPANTGSLCSHGQLAGGPPAVRARLHFGGPAASRLADGATPRRPWAFNVPTSTERRASSASRLPGSPSRRIDMEKHVRVLFLLSLVLAPELLIAQGSTASQGQKPQTPPASGVAQPPLKHGTQWLLWF